MSAEAFYLSIACAAQIVVITFIGFAHIAADNLGDRPSPRLVGLALKALQRLNTVAWVSFYLQLGQVMAAAFFLYHKQWWEFVVFAGFASIGLIINQCALHSHRMISVRLKPFLPKEQTT